MIRITNISNVKRGEQDYAYAIVRSMKHPSDWLVQLPVLSPSTGLFFDYRRMANAGTWNARSFEERYVPRFLEEMRSPEARAELNRLYRLDRQGATVALCCFCRDESLCHRSIIAGLLQGVGANVRVDGGADYSRYWSMFLDG